MHAPKIRQEVETQFLRSDLPEFRVGDTIIVHSKIKEGAKERIQYVEGLVIRKTGTNSTRTFTLRKISSGIGVEIIYPYASKLVAKIEVVSRGNVRRGRLYYIRNLTGKAARLKQEAAAPEAKETAAAPTA